MSLQAGEEALSLLFLLCGALTPWCRPDRWSKARKMQDTYGYAPVRWQLLAPLLTV